MILIHLDHHIPHPKADLAAHLTIGQVTRTHPPLNGAHIDLEIAGDLTFGRQTLREGNPTGVPGTNVLWKGDLHTSLRTRKKIPLRVWANYPSKCLQFLFRTCRQEILQAAG